jgi:hypothetical protein
MQHNLINLGKTSPLKGPTTSTPAHWISSFQHMNPWGPHLNISKPWKSLSNKTDYFGL